MEQSKLLIAKVVTSALGVFLRVPANWDRNPEPGWLIVQLWN
jgi:hypothetical protein